MGKHRTMEVGTVFLRNDLLAPLACSEIRSKTGRTRRPFVPLWFWTPGLLPRPRVLLSLIQQDTHHHFSLANLALAQSLPGPTAAACGLLPMPDFTLLTILWPRIYGWHRQIRGKLDSRGQEVHLDYSLIGIAKGLNLELKLGPDGWTNAGALLEVFPAR